MKLRLLLYVATGMLVATSSTVLACDEDGKSAQAASSDSKTCTAEMAAHCSAAQAAACKAKGASAVTTVSRGTRGVNAVNAMASGSSACAHGASARSASSVCPHGMSMKTASSECAQGASAKGACKAHGAAVTAANGTCGGRGMTAAAERYAHGDCDACADMSTCDDQLRASGAITQIVKLKNGIMYVYTAQQPGKVRAVQAAVTQRNDRLAAIKSAGDKAKLCPECKSMRGAMASGKLTREMVAIEGGCLTLVTSTDPSLVNKLHAMVNQQTASRVKI